MGVGVGVDGIWSTVLAKDEAHANFMAKQTHFVMPLAISPLHSHLDFMMFD